MVLQQAAGTMRPMIEGEGLALHMQLDPITTKRVMLVSGCRYLLLPNPTYRLPVTCDREKLIAL
jgi:hypothetical protein